MNNKIKIYNDYSEFINTFDINRINLVKTDFEVTPNINIPQNYELNIRRGKSELSLLDNVANVLVGFEIIGLHEKNEVFIGHYIFQICFHLIDKEMFNLFLENDSIKNQFLNTQIDKLVWSFLRQKILQSVLDSGFQPIYLPLYR